jgi:hypothetical protein
MQATRFGFLGLAVALIRWKRIAAARASSRQAADVEPARSPDRRALATRPAPIAEPHGAWLTAEQNQLFAIRNAAAHDDDRTAGDAADVRAACQLLEIFTAIVPFERG